jgi:hypothetical protein
LTNQVGTTLCSDEMSKLGKKVIAFALTDTNGDEFALGLRDLKTKVTSMIRGMLNGYSNKGTAKGS